MTTNDRKVVSFSRTLQDGRTLIASINGTINFDNPENTRTQINIINQELYQASKDEIDASLKEMENAIWAEQKELETRLKDTDTEPGAEEGIGESSDDALFTMG